MQSKSSKIFLLCSVLLFIYGISRGQKIVTPEYSDGRPHAILRMDAKDMGIVLHYGNGPDLCDKNGARDPWVFESKGKYYMHYDACGPKGWLCALAVSKGDLSKWEKLGPVLDLGEPGSNDAKSASYGTTYFDGKDWHMYYAAMPNVTPDSNMIPMFPYYTKKAISKNPNGPWKKQNEIIPFGPKPNTYYSSTTTPGQIIKYKDEYLQFFSAADYSVKRTIGIARTKNLNGSWTIMDKPILPPNEQLENTSLYFESSNQTWYLFTDHIGNYNGIEYTDAIWVYWSKDLLSWDPKNKAVVLDGQNCTWSKKCIGLPSVIKTGNKLAIFYDTPGGESTDHMKRNIGLAYLDLPLVTPKKK